MVKLRINKNKVIPDVKEYIKVIISSFFTYYIFKLFLIKCFPFLDELTIPISIIVWTSIVIYFKGLIDIKFMGRDWF